MIKFVSNSIKMLKKTFLFSLSFIVIFTVQSFSQTEMSYKTGDDEPRYLSKFKMVDYNYPKDVSNAIIGVEDKADEMIKLLNKTGEAASKNEWFSKIQNENIYLSIVDLGNYRITLKIADGSYEVVKGFKKKTPSMVLKLFTRNIRDLHEFFSDGKLTEEEKYRIFYIVSVPAIRAIYYNEPNYRAGDKSVFKFDNMVQISIPPKGLYVDQSGVPLNIELTAVNVDGQWLVFRGLHGDPDFRLKLTLQEAAELYRIGYYEVNKVKTPKQAKKLSDEFLLLLNKTLDYRRKDHKD